MMNSDRLIGKRKEKPGWIGWGIFLGFLILYTSVYFWFGTRLIYQTNLDPSRLGQQEYLDSVYRAKLQKENNNPDTAENAGISSALSRSLPNFVDGRIDPLWPWLLSFTEDTDPESLFRKGKWINVIVCGVLLVLLGLIAAKSFSFLSASSILLIGGLGFLLDRAVLFRGDGFFLMLTVMAWICILSLIRSDGLWKYGILGCLLGVLFLVNAFIWPMIVALAFTSLLRSISSRREADDGETRTFLWNAPNQIVGLAVAVTAFMVVAGPRLSFSDAKFGNAFHRYDDWTMWLNSPEEAKQFIADNPGKTELDFLRKHHRPGFWNYLDDKGGRALWDRCLEGVRDQSSAIFPGKLYAESSREILYWKPGWWLLYFGIVFGAIGVIHRMAAFRKKDQVWRVGGTSARWVLTFAVITVALTLVWMGIGHLANRDSTVTASLFLPVLITLIWITERFRRQLQRTRDAGLVNRINFWAMLFPTAFITARIGILLV